MIARCLVNDRHFLDALYTLFIILRAVSHSSEKHTYKVSNTFHCSKRIFDWHRISINYIIGQEVWRETAKDSYSNSIMLPRTLQALFSQACAFISTLVPFYDCHLMNWRWPQVLQELHPPPAAQVENKTQRPFSSWGSTLNLPLLFLWSEVFIIHAHPNTLTGEGEWKKLLLLF